MTVVGIDVGGTKTLVGLFEEDGRRLAVEEFVTRNGGDDIERVVALGASTLDRWQRDESTAAWASPSSLRGIAAGFPEYVSREGLLTSHEVLTWSTQPHSLLAAALHPLGLDGLPLVIESDVRLGAWGEARYGVGVDARDFVYISLGTGLSSTVVLDGRPWAGVRGEAIGLGEWHPLVDVSGPLATEGFRGNLEGYASGAGIAARFERITGGTTTTRELVAAAEAGDDLSRAILVSAGTAIGRACSEIVNVLDPAAIVLGGGLGAAPTPVRDAIHRSYEALGGSRAGRPPLVVAHNGADAGLLGAAAAAVAASSITTESQA